MIELAARIWKTSVRSAVHSLRQTVMLENPVFDQKGSVELYLEKYVQRRKDTLEFWQEVTESLPRSSDDLRAFRMHVSQAVGHDPSRWKSRGGQFLGAADRDKIREMVAYNHSDPMTRRNIFGPRRKWRNAWIMATWDLPGRINGFVYLIGENEIVYKAVGKDLFACRGEEDHVLAGMTMLEALRDCSPGTKTMFAIMDPVVAMRLQISNFTEEDAPLPIVGVWPESPPCPYLWEGTVGHELVIWAEKPTKHVLRHARASNSLLTAIDRAEDTFSALRRHKPTEWLRRVRKHAKPWHVVLAEMTRVTPAAEMTEIIRFIELTTEEIHQYSADWSVEAREAINRLFETQNLYRKTVVNGRTVEETPQGWVLERARDRQLREVICDATIRIDQLVRQPQLKKSFYRGTITFHGEQYPFVAPQDEMDKDTFGWVDQFLVEKRVGTLTANRRWRGHAMTIAKKFHKPEVVVGLDRFGWDRQNRSWVFSDFLLNDAGEVRPNQVEVVDRSHNAIKLERPAELSAMTVERLSNRDLAQAFWPVMAAVLYQVEAPYFGYEPQSVAFLGDNRSLRSISESLGCEFVTASTRFPSQTAASLRLREESGWPVAAQTTSWGQALNELLTEPAHSIVLLEADELALIGPSVSGYWLVSDELKGFAANPGFLKVAQSFMASVLSFLMAEGYRRVGAGSNFRRTVHDLERWFSAAGGNPRVVRNACRVLSARSQIDGLARGLIALFERGLLGFQRSGFLRPDDGEPDIIFQEEKRAIWLPMSRINQLLNRRGYPLIDLDCATKLLADQQLLLADQTDDLRGRGFLVPESWWNQSLNAFRRKPTLKICGA